MNAKYKNLYQELVSRDMTDLDENSFYNEYSQNDNKFSELYSYLDSNEMTDLDPETFKLEYFGTPIIKKKSEVESTDSDSEVGSSEQLSTTTTKQLEPSIYILPSNPGALYRKKGDSWLKKIGENYIPLSKGDVRARERILDKQAVLASDFQADWYSNQAKEIPESEYATQEQVNKAYPDLPKERWKGATVTPIDQTIPTEKTRAFEQEEAKDSILPETKIEPATFEGKLYMLEEGKDNENFYKNPVTEETYLYWLDNNGKPKERLDPIKSQEAVDMAANIIGESQMKQLSKINKIDKIDLNKRDVDKFLKKELYGSNFGFNQEGNELTINSYFPGMNGDDEGLENSITIDLSKSNSSSIAKEFLRYNLFTKREKEGLENIKDTESYIDAMINSNGKIKMTSDRVDVISEWARTESMAIENDIKRNEVDVIDKDIKSYEEKTKLFKKRVASGNMTQQEFDKENDDLSKLYKDISIKQKRAQELSNRAQKLISAEELIQKKVAPEEKGSTIGALVKSFTSGMSNLALTGLDYSLSAGNLIMGDEKFSKLIDGNYGEKKAKGLTDAQIANTAQATVKDFAKVKYDLGWGIITGTNKEYIRSENRGMIPQALNAVAESFGTAATGGALGKVGSTAAFFSMSYNAMEDQMRGPDFDHLNENEKKLISVPYGLVIGQMEKWGFDIAVGAGKNPLFNKFANYIVTKTFKNLPKNAGLIELNSAIQKNIGASIAKGLIKITGAGVSEGNVEFMQQEFEGIQKFAVNEILKNDNFNEEYFKDAPDLSKAGGWSELMGQGVDAFKLGFLAGGMTSAGASVKDNITDISSNNKFDIYKSFVLNTESRNGWIASIKEDQKNGKISPEEMNKKIDELNKSYSVLTKIPASLTTQSQREAFSLLQEREIIQNEIKDKDPNLVVKETNRIKEINESLKTTSENATKEDNIVQQEGTAEGGISEYQGTGEGQQEVGVSQGGQRETTINEADSGDSTVASKVQQEEQVATYRAEEQAELLKAIPKIESYKVNGEIDKTLMPKTVLAKYNKIYDKYDKLISPLLETTGEVAIDKPVITTNTTAEVERVKSLTPESEDGATFNIDGTKYEGVGLVVPVDSMNTTTEELTPEMVADFVAERQKMIGDAGVVKAGIYKFPNSNQVSIDLSVVVPETSREQALEFARLAGQESLFDLETFENIKTGATGENPMSFSPEQHREISKALKEGRMPNVFGATAETTNNLLTKENVKEFASKQKTTAHKLIVKAAKMVLNAIPGVKIYIHNNGQEMASAIESSKRQLTKEEKTGLTESSGLYVDGDIHINLESATIGTVYHEAFHALIEKNGMKSGSILLMAKGLKNIISDKGIKQRLDDFVSQYNEDEKAEEYISELGGILSEAEQELTTTKLQQFKTLINNIAKKLGLPVIFSASATAQDAADFINTMSKKLRTGEEIENIFTDGIQLNVVNPTGIKKQIEFKNDYKLSFVKKEDIINIEELIKNISESGQKVWFWMADQLGRGYVFDEVSGEEHYLDAGPSFALDPKNKSKRIIWASGKTAKDIQKLINNSDYIFLVSGNPETAKLFNKAVFDLYTKKLGDYNSFKKEVLSNKPRKEISEVLNAHDSWETLREDSSTDNTKTKKIGTGRKKFLMVLNDVVNKPNATLNKILKDKNAIIDINSIRDDFYADNGFKQNDIMLVLKAEKLGGKSDHSTYENDLIGDVVGVPDKKINAYDILSDEDKARYKDASNSDRNKQQAITAPYGSGIRNVQPSKIKFQKNKTDKLTAPVAGNKLFNEPLKQALDIAKSYMKSIGKEYSPVEKITKLDEGLSKRISDAYDKMKDDPTDPEVKAAYEAMAKETLDQYDAITAKGYKLEINNNEPYSSSEDMINDLRDNNRMKIFSTESGFGEEPITDKQREENILLKDSGRKDANGETLLVNDVFRFVHDFFGHAKLGNSFGPIGEENAWRVHSEMYSPEAKKAMTSETRGQNSWVNFSGVNDAAFKKREKARQLRKEGKIDQANQMVGEVYDEMKFADQKIGLLPSFAVEEGAPSKIKKQLIGKNANLSQNVRDNLQVARDMENAKKDAKTIRIATGWERGADDKWRYEVPDIKFKKEFEGEFLFPIDKLEKNWSSGVAMAKLSDLFDAKSLFESYNTELQKELPLYKEDGTISKGGVLYNNFRKLEDITVYFEKGGYAEGEYDPRYNNITISFKPGNSTNEEILVIIAHEIQHYIQDREGFAVGTVPENPSIEAMSVMPKLNKLKKEIIEKTKYDSIEDLKSGLIKEIENSSFSKTRDYINWEGSRKSLFIEFLKDENYDGKIFKGGINKIFSEYLKMQNQIKSVGYGNYIKYAGEVESRNVEKRIKMTPEERRQTTLQETEDVSREDQIIFFEEGAPSKIKKQLTTDKYAKPGAKSALDALGETNDQREVWRKNNKVNQKQKRNPIVEQAVKDYYNEKINQEQYLDIVAKNQPIKPFKTVPALPSLEDITNSLDISKVATGIIGLTKNLENGEKVASRLDIPAYEDYDTWVVSLHDGNKEGKSIAYGQTAVLKNVDFKTFPGSAIRIAMGTQNKSTIGRMFGDWVNEDPELVHARAKELINDPAWTQVGMNPFRYSWFYDKSDGMPVASADEVIQVGALVLAKNAKKVLPSDPIFETKSAKGGKIKFQKTAPNGKPSKLDDVQWEQVRTPAFKKWFGDWENDPQNASKILDSNGEPMPVYHGTTEDFEIFMGGSYLTDDYMNADGYAAGEIVLETFLNIKNPLIIDAKGRKWDKLKNKYGSSTREIVSNLDDKNNDGVVFNNINDNWFDDEEGGTQNVYYTLEPNQVKLADGTNTTFDATQPSIKFQKKAPSVDKILGTPKPSMVTVKEKTALKDQIKLEARAAREAKGDLNQKRKLLSTAIKGLVKLGKLTTRQAAIIIDRIGYVNLDNQVMVNRLADYAARVFEKADYQERLSRAFSFRKGIRKLLKGDIQAEVVGMAKKFSKIDPSMVDDIEKYLEMAEIVKNAIKPSRINKKDGDVNMRESMNINSVSEFINNAIENQEAILKEELLAVHSELVDAGVIDKDMSLKDIELTINSLKEKEDDADYETDIRTFLSNRIDTMSEIIKDILTYKINPMTGEEVALTEKNIDLISRIINIDINNVSIKEAIFIAEAMDNFINNNITSSVESVIEKHEGATELENLIADKVVASPLRKYFSNKIGQYMSEQVASMPILFEKLFVGAKKGLMVAKKMGWTALINGVNKAEKMFNTTVDVYFKQYKNTKPNGKSFNDAENVYERGMLAFLSRNVSGTVTQQAEELKRRVEVLKESVKSLLEGSSKEQKMGELYQKIYDKLNVESGDIDVIHANADKINRSAVGWWINQWGTTYNDLSDISLSVYNTMLSSDTSYSTDRYKLLDKSNLEEIIEPKNIGAFGRDIEFLDKNKTGVLMESNRPSASKVSKANRYISLDFDVNNSSAYKAALIDVNTAAAIRRIDGFINSKNFNKLIPTKEDRDIFRKRIAEYIQAAKNKRVGPSDTMHYLDQLTNFLGGIGVGKALGGIDQIIKQTLPIALSTFTNSGRLDILTPASNAWIDSLGMAISNRGQESQSTIESIDRRLDKANSGAKVVSNFIVDAQQIWLKWCLSKPDVFIAKSSFISYYKQYLSNNNQSTDIDWATHNVNQDAADYAMLMVDRQQNVSDAKMAGKVFNSQNSTTKIMRKLFLPFASFSLNQKSRMVSDIKVLGINSGASKQDRAIAFRSLASLPLEMALYQSIGLAIRLGYLAIAKGIIGAVADDDDEEKEKLLGMEVSKEMKNATKYPLRSMVTDFLSPIPIADNTVVGGANYLLSQLSVDQDMIDEAVSKKNQMLEVSGKEKMNDKEKQNFIEKYKQDREYQLFNDEKKSYGTIGIGYDTYKELMGNINTAYTGQYTDDYMGKESERFLLPKDQDNIKNAVIFETLFALGIVPRDVNTVTNNIIKLSKKNSLTEAQYEKYKAVGKETGGKVTGWKMDLVKSKSKTESTLEELEWIKEYGGLTEKQGQEYVKLSEVIGKISYMKLIDLQSGKTADQIIKYYSKK